MINGTVKKWGNSPAVRIPATIMQALNLNIDDEIKIDLIGGKLVIEPVPKAETVFTIEQLVSGITPDNLHDVIEWGDPVGKEIW